MISNECDFARALDQYLTREQHIQECENLRALPYYSSEYCDTLVCIVDCCECNGQCDYRFLSKFEYS
jgi:hypothetical protein